MITAEVIYIDAKQQCYRWQGNLPQGSVAEQAIMAFRLKFPDLLLAENKDLSLGVYSTRIELSTPLNDGDRVEVYRSLVLDPKQRRRLKAKKTK